MSNLPGNQTKIQGQPLTLTNQTPTRTGFTFVNYSGSDGNSYSPGGSYTTDANLILTASWTTTPTPPTPTPPVTYFWHTGCCSTNNVQYTGYSTVDFAQAYNAMTAQCAGGQNAIPSSANGSYTSAQSNNVPSLNCAAPTPTPAVGTTYWSTGCCLNGLGNNQVIGTSTQSAGAASSNMTANCGCCPGTIDSGTVQTGSYTGSTSNIPTINCVQPTPTPTPPTPTTPTPTTPTPTPTPIVIPSCTSYSSSASECNGFLCCPIPNLVGSCAPGFAALGFNLSYSYVGTTDAGLAGCVISQTPAGGTCGDCGTTISLTAYQYQAPPTPVPTSTPFYGCCCDGTPVSGGYNGSGEASTGLSSQCSNKGGLCAGPQANTAYTNCSSYGTPTPTPPTPTPPTCTESCTFIYNDGCDNYSCTNYQNVCGATGNKRICTPTPTPPTPTPPTPTPPTPTTPTPTAPVGDCPGQTPFYGNRCTAGDVAFDILQYCTGGVGACSFASGAQCLLFCI